MRNVNKNLKHFLFCLIVVFLAIAPALAQRQNNRNRNGNATVTPSPYTSTSPQDFVPSQDSNRFNTFLGVGVGLLVLTTIIVGLIARSKSKQIQLANQDRQWREVYVNSNAIDAFSCGLYVGGLYPGNANSSSTNCLVSCSDFIFVDSTQYQPIGSIARNKIAGIQVETNTTTYKRVPPAAYLLLLLGPLGIIIVAFAREQVTHNNYNLVINWEDDRKFLQKAIFKFRENHSAVNEAGKKINEYALARM